MTEVRLAIIFAFVVDFWGLVLAIYVAMRGDRVVAAVGVSALIPVTLMFLGFRAVEDMS